ncbi:LuxR family transcriptional regulator, partial [Burkholderia cenocepacia]
MRMRCRPDLQCAQYRNRPALPLSVRCPMATSSGCLHRGGGTSRRAGRGEPRAPTRMRMHAATPSRMIVFPSLQTSRPRPMSDAEVHLAPLRIFDAVRALAFIGDLSMGQPTDHSPRTGWLAAQLAHAARFDASVCDTAREVALLRWSGCTANAAGFAQVFGDDVAIRAAMLEGRPGIAEAIGGAGVALIPLAQIHCEVSGEVAR